MARLLKFVLLSTLFMTTLFASLPEALPAPVSTEDYHGFPCYDFQLDGIPAKIVPPKETAPGVPWLWRARFWGHEPQTDIAMLKAGFHLVYIDVADLYGAPVAMQRFDKFYAFLVGTLHFNAKCCLEGMSRGGLFIFNWSAANPEKIAAIYADAPVCDTCAWPVVANAADETRNNPQSDFNKCLKAYGMTEEQMRKYPFQPWQFAAKILGEKGIPVLSVCGGADDVVPMETDILRFRQVYDAAGGTLRLITKPTCWHHPHSLKDPSVIVNFLLAQTVGYNAFIRPRNGLCNALETFRQEKHGTVAFLGGSIVEMNGFSRMTEENLRRLFPECAFTFINAGISSTCSDTGAFRLERDVLSAGKVDLLFVEFATNDTVDGRDPLKHSAKSMEGIIRHARLANPKMDIILIHTANEKNLHTVGGLDMNYTPETGIIESTAAVHSGKAALAQSANADGLNHVVEYENARPARLVDPVVKTIFEKIAEHYGLPSIDFNGDVEERIYHGEFGWQKFGGVHPAPFGNQIYADDILCLIQGELAKPRPAQISDYPLPTPLDPLCFATGVLLSPETVQCGDGWQVSVPEWQKIPGEKRDRYTSCLTLHSTTPNAECTLDFTGSAIGIFLTAGADAGILEYSIDGGDWQKTDLFDERYSALLHYPYSIIFADDLDSSRAHTLRMRNSAAHNPRSQGNAVRIMAFTVNP